MIMSIIDSFIFLFIYFILFFNFKIQGSFWSFTDWAFLMQLAFRVIALGLPSFYFILFYFPTVQQGDQVILTCIHYNYIFPPPFLLLQHEYLDIDLNATQQDLLVKHSKLCLINPRARSLPLPPSPSRQPQISSPNP